MNFNAIRELVNPKTVIDVGANTGWFAQNLRQSCPTVDITMIEANPNCEDKLSDIGYPYAIVALSNDVKENVKFYINKDDNICCGASLYKEDTKFYDDCVVIEVETHTLDEGELYPDGIDLLKIDVQGSEKDILEGSIETLKRTKHILLECSFSNYNLGAPQIEDVVDFVKKNGFYPMAILEEHWSRLASKCGSSD
jgi:FkbM family methyltransferase